LCCKKRKWHNMCVATPFLEECEIDNHTPKMGTFETSEFDSKGQNTWP